MAYLHMAAVVERSEGRKSYVEATLSAGDVLCAKASALLVAPADLERGSGS